MRTSVVFVATLLVFLAAASSTARAQSKVEYSIDKEHSSIVFKVMNRGVSYVWGRFNDISGTLTTDKRYGPEAVEVNVTANPRSIDTNSKERDRHLKGRDFFDTSTFKTIAFETKKVKKLEETGKFELTGELTILGKKSPLTVVFELTGEKDLPGNVHRIGGQCTFTVKRSELGLGVEMKDIADDVLIMVNLEGKMKAIPMG